jgi:hypothetical protein
VVCGVSLFRTLELASRHAATSKVRRDRQCVRKVYGTRAVVAILAFGAPCKVNNLRVFNTGPGFDSHPGHHRFLLKTEGVLPTDESLAAFADRFLVRVFVETIEDPQLETLLGNGWKLDHSKFSKLASMNDIDVLAEVASRPQRRPTTIGSSAANLAECRHRPIRPQGCQSAEPNPNCYCRGCSWSFAA